MTQQTANIHPHNSEALVDAIRTMELWTNTLKTAKWNPPFPTDSICACGAIDPARKYVPTLYSIKKLAEQAELHSLECRQMAQTLELRERRNAQEAPGRLIEHGMMAFQYFSIFLQTPRPDHRDVARAVLDRTQNEVETALQYSKYCGTYQVVKVLRSVQAACKKIRKIPGIL